jgi:hypothetical protein
MLHWYGSRDSAHVLLRHLFDDRWLKIVDGNREFSGAIAQVSRAPVEASCHALYSSLSALYNRRHDNNQTESRPTYMSVIQRIWKGSVGANVIAGLILLAAGSAWASLVGLSWNHPVSIQLWGVVVWGVLSAVAVLYIARDAIGKNTDKEQSQTAPRPTQNKLVIERLSNQLRIRYDFVARPGEPKRTGQAVWEESYLEVVRILGPKLMAGAEEASVQR